MGNCANIAHAVLRHRKAAGLTRRQLADLAGVGKTVVFDKVYQFDRFPPFFEGLLPAGMQLEALIRQTKTHRDDLFSRLLIVGGDLVGSVTVEAE